MKGEKVLDSWALLAYFEDEPCAGKVADFLKEASEKDRSLLISAVNWGEILYVVERKYGSEKRDQIENWMEQMYLEVVPADKDIAREAARLKAAHKLGYADSFAAAIASLRKTELVTGDRDFQVVSKEIKITWL